MSRARSHAGWMVLALALAFCPCAHADMARTLRTATLRTKASSSSKSIDKVPADTSLAVLERSADGKWIKVLFGEGEGWIALREVEVTADPVSTETTADGAGSGAANAGASGTNGPNGTAGSGRSGGSGGSGNSDGGGAAGGGASGKGSVRPEVWVSDSRYHAGDGAGAVIVGARTADLVDRPREGARKVGEARPGTRLATARKSRDEAWFLVELGDGRAVWIAADAVTVAAPDHATPSPVTSAKATPGASGSSAAPGSSRSPRARAAAVSNEGVADAPVPAGSTTISAASDAAAAGEAASPGEPADIVTRSVRGSRRLHLALGAAFALGEIEQRFTSNASGPLTQYGDRTGLVGVEIGLEVDARVSAGWFVGASGSYRFLGAADLSAPAGAGTVTLGVRSHDLEALGLLGYRTGALGGLSVSLGAGMRMLLDLIDKDFTVAVPSERLTALQIGLGLDIPRLPFGLGVSVALAWLPVGSRDLTEHLGEGQDIGTSGFSAGLALSYPLFAGVSVRLAGQYAQATTEFDGVAARNPAITRAQRATTLSDLSLGLRYAY